jgi:hypothetical protein
LSALHGGGLRGAEAALRHLQVACRRLKDGDVAAYALAETAEAQARAVHRYLWMVVQSLKDEAKVKRAEAEAPQPVA